MTLQQKASAVPKKRRNRCDLQWPTVNFLLFSHPSATAPTLARTHRLKQKLFYNLSLQNWIGDSYPASMCAPFTTAW